MMMGDGVGRNTAPAAHYCKPASA